MPSPVASTVFWAAVLCCVVAEAAIVRSTARVRTAGANDPGAGTFPPVRRGAEVAWAVLPALALAAVLAWTWREMRRPAPLPSSGVPAAAADGAPVVP